MTATMYIPMYIDKYFFLKKKKKKDYRNVEGQIHLNIKKKLG